MNSRDAHRMREALHDLADGPVPVALADRALAAATRRRGVRVGLTAAAAVAVLALVIPLVAYLRPSPSATVDPLGNSPTINPTVPATPPAPPRAKPCAVATGNPNDSALWLDFVVATVAALPPRTDYVQESGWAWCDNPDNSNAYAVIGLGANREFGHITVYMYIHQTNAVAADCAAAATPPSPSPGDEPARYVMTSCVDRTPDSPMVVVHESGSDVWVSAVYPDGRTILMQSIRSAPDRHLTITTDIMRTALLNPVMHDVIPDTAGTPLN